MGNLAASSPYIIHRDPDFIITEKPPGLLSVPGRGPDKADCLFSRLAEDFQELRVVHRLDQPTSGLMVWALNLPAQRELSRQFEQRQTRKEYQALISGPLPSPQGEIRLKQRLDPDNRPLQVVDPLQGKEGITQWEVLSGPDEKPVRVRLIPRTGRTHQLRLHMARSGCPIEGDSLYGDGEPGGRMCLHACGLAILHPVSGELLEFRSPVPF